MSKENNQWKYAHPYYRSPYNQKTLKQQVNLEKLPMFNPLSRTTGFPDNMIFPYAPYFQGQGFHVPRHNKYLCGRSPQEKEKLQSVKNRLS